MEHARYNSYLFFTVTDEGAMSKAIIACITPRRIYTFWTRGRSVDAMLDGGHGHRHQLVAKSAECVANERLPDGLFTPVQLRGMETGISEASKRVPIFSFATQGSKQGSS